MNNKIDRLLPNELLDKHFPKYQCKERGSALVLWAEIKISLQSTLNKEGVCFNVPTENEIDKIIYPLLTKPVRQRLVKAIHERLTKG